MEEERKEQNDRYEQQQREMAELRAMMKAIVEGQAHPPPSLIQQQHPPPFPMCSPVSEDDSEGEVLSEAPLYPKQRCRRCKRWEEDVGPGKLYCAMCLCIHCEERPVHYDEDVVQLGGTDDAWWCVECVEGEKERLRQRAARQRRRGSSVSGNKRGRTHP